MANTLTSIYLGRHKTAPESDFGTINSGVLRSCVFNALSDNAWFEELGIWAGKNTGTNATIRLCCYETDASYNPVDRVCYGASSTANVSMTDATGGASITSAISVSDNSPSNASFMGFSGAHYGLGVLATAASLMHSMKQAASITADNEQFYDRSGLSQPPPDPYGSYSASVQGHLTIWAKGWVNVDPEVPVAASMSPSGTITSLTPTFTVPFQDKNGDYGASSGLGIDNGDELRAYRIVCEIAATGVDVWAQSFTATASEIAANAVSQAYGGSALSRGTLYQWQIKVSDKFGGYSAYSTLVQFTPASLGFVTLDSTPTGKIEAVSGSTALDFNGRWNHQSATTMKTVQARILDEFNVVLQTGANYNIADVASSALPGTLFTITWANTGFTTLSWGKNYKYQIRGYDGTNWSDWSSSRTFNTNAAPTVPTSLSPSNSSSWSSLPLLSCSFTDIDDTTATGLTGVFRITRPDTSTVDVTPTYNATTLLWEFQTTAVQLSAFGAYSWIATGYDGTLYSGEATALASASFSTSASFNYINGPTVTVTAPTNNSTVTTATVPVTWTTTGQVSYVLTVYKDNDSGTVIYTSGTVVSAVGSATIPTGYLQNNTNYDIVVKVTDTTPLDGYSNVVNILVAYTPATPASNFSATAVRVTTDPAETAIRVSWDQTAYGSPDFYQYILKRSANGGPDAAEVTLKRFTSAASVQLVDYTPVSGYEYTYTLIVSVLVGTDIVESARVTTTESLTLTSVVLTLVGNGGTYRANLQNANVRTHNRVISETVYQSLSSAQPVTIRNKTWYWEADFSGFLVDTTESTAQQKYDELTDLDEQNGLVCYRDGRKKKRFCRIVDLKIVDELPSHYSYSFKLREERITEGTI